MAGIFINPCALFTMTPHDIKVLQQGLALAGLWIDEIPALEEEDFDPGTFERWIDHHENFQALVERLTAHTPDKP